MRQLQTVCQITRKEDYIIEKLFFDPESNDFYLLKRDLLLYSVSIKEALEFCKESGSRGALEDYFPDELPNDNL